MGIEESIKLKRVLELAETATFRGEYKVTIAAALADANVPIGATFTTRDPVGGNGTRLWAYRKDGTGPTAYTSLGPSLGGADMGNGYTDDPANLPIPLAVQTPLDNRVRVDAAQGLTTPQKAQARSNIDLGNVANLAPADLPVSTAQAVADALKIDKSQTGVATNTNVFDAPTYIREKDRNIFHWLTDAQWADTRKGTPLLDLTAVIQKALDDIESEATTSPATLRRNPLLFPAGNYRFVDMEIPDSIPILGANAGGLAVGNYGTRLMQVPGSNTSLLKLKGHVISGDATLKLWSQYTGVARVAVLGDNTATAGCGLEAVNRLGQAVNLADYFVLQECIFRGWAEDNIWLRGGVTPGFFRDIVSFHAKGWNMRVSNLSMSSLSAIDQNASNAVSIELSTDGGGLGGLLLEDFSPHGSCRVTMKIERALNSRYSSITDGNKVALELRNMDRVPVALDFGSYISSVADASAPIGFKNPGPFVKISGNGLPKLSWWGIGQRRRLGATEDPGTYVVQDAVRSRNFSCARTVGSINLKGAWFKQSNLNGLNNGSQQSLIYNSIKIGGAAQDPEILTLGDFVVGAIAIDTQGILRSMAYVRTSEASSGVQPSPTITPGECAMVVANRTGGNLTFGNPNIWFMKLHKDTLSYQASGAYTFNGGANLATGLQVTNTLALPGAKLGDFVVASLGSAMNSLIGQPYVSADNQATLLVMNHTGSNGFISATTLRFAVVPERSCRRVAAYVYSIPAMTAGAAPTVITIPCDDALLTDFVVKSFSLDLAGIYMDAWVSSAGNIKVAFYNGTGVDYAGSASGLIKVGLLDTDHAI
ncbi:hypothetical protein [Novosphingobium colocasiae]|uniref:hypothetical protein n=1 Tax=Novosphingobium colocasiae TaxID=1256513 RepID=UPI0035B07117